MSPIAPTMQMFFTDRLAKQRQASPATVRSYRTTMVLLLRFVENRTGKQPAVVGWEDLDVATISAFLDHLEEERHNGARSRNARLAAIRSLFRFAALRHPEHAQQIAPGSRRSSEAVGQAAGLVPRTGRDRGAPRRGRPRAMGREAGSCSHRARRADRSAALGADRPHLR